MTSNGEGNSVSNGSVADSTGASEDSTGDSGESTQALEYVCEIDKSAILSVEITADPAWWQTMLDNATDEEYIPADVIINGVSKMSASARKAIQA